MPYLTSSPTGGPLPTRLSSGVAHYFGVGAYLRPLADVRAARVRFAGECLAFATPPEPAAVAALAGDPPDLDAAGWLDGVPRDSGTDWTFEDVRDFYVRSVLGVEPAELRRADPRRYLDLGRAAVCEAVEAVFGHWRRADSGCAGGLVLTLRDWRPGPGWGLLDVEGAPKAPWWSLRRMLAPVAVTVTDEGLDGLQVHAFNDTAEAVAGSLRVAVVGPGGHVVDEAETRVVLEPRSAASWDVEALLGGFRDLTGAHRFGVPMTGGLLAVLTGSEGPLARAARPLPGPGQAPTGDLGLSATAVPDGDGWLLTVATTEFAERVAVDVSGHRAEDSWFHLTGAQPHTVRLHPVGPPGVPVGTVRALNAAAPVPVRGFDPA